MYIINYNFIYIYIYKCVCVVRTFRSNAFQHQLRYSCLSVYLNCGRHTECCSLVNSWWSSFPWALHALRNPPLDGSQIAWPIGVCKSHFDHFFFSRESNMAIYSSHRLWMVLPIKASIYRWFAHQFSHQSFHQKSGPSQLRSLGTWMIQDRPSNHWDPDILTKHAF